MDTLLKVIIAAATGMYGFFVYCLMRVASEEDRRMEQLMHRSGNKPPDC